MHSSKPLFLVKQVAWLLTWLETLLITTSSALLTFVAVLTVASALNGGRLLDTNPALTQAFAWCQGIGVEGQLAGMTFAATRCSAERRIGKAVGLWAVVGVLAFASIMAGGAVNYQESFHVSFEQALAYVGISREMWVWVRIVVLVGLIILAAAIRYVPEEDAKTTIKKIQNQAAIDQARAQARNQHFATWGKGIRDAAAAVSGQDAPVPVASNGHMTEEPDLTNFQ